MNKQGPNGIEWTHIFGPGTGYTWNPVGGCLHGCEWNTPGGRAECYAKTVAEGLARKAYPDGFEAHYWRPNVLREPLSLRKPAGIFLDSMSDLFGHWVPENQVREILYMCRRTPWHVYFSLTKNAPRILEFADEIPWNVFVGVSSPPDFMFGGRLNYRQKGRMLEKSLKILRELRWKWDEDKKPHITWMSFEPLSWDLSPIVQEYPDALKWAVIGAASRGREVYQIDPEYVTSLEFVLEIQDVPVFYKGNLAGNPAVAAWREEYPKLPWGEY